MNLVPDASLDSYRVADHKPFPCPSLWKSRHSFFVCPFFPPSIITRPRGVRHPFCILSLSFCDRSLANRKRPNSKRLVRDAQSVKVSGSALCSQRDRERGRRRYITSRISSIPGRLSRNVILTRLFVARLRTRLSKHRYLGG